jgi:hypothetical protein
LVYDENNRKDTASFNIDPFDLFDYIVFDPRMNDTTVLNNTKLIQKLGFKNSISRSSLYESPNVVLNF